MVPRGSCPRPFQAAPGVPLRRRAAQEPVGQDPAPQATRGKMTDVSEPGTYDGFRLERDEARGVATVTLDVPGKMNRVSMPAREQLAALFEQLGTDTGVRAIVLTGAGDQAFT